MSELYKALHRKCPLKNNEEIEITQCRNCEWLSIANTCRFQEKTDSFFERLKNPSACYQNAQNFKRLF